MATSELPPSSYEAKAWPASPVWAADNQEQWNQMKLHWAKAKDAYKDATAKLKALLADRNARVTAQTAK